jgi:cell division control protein 24
MRKWADKVMELANAERKKQNEYRAERARLNGRYSGSDRQYPQSSFAPPTPASERPPYAFPPPLPSQSTSGYFVPMDEEGDESGFRSGRTTPSIGSSATYYSQAPPNRRVQSQQAMPADRQAELRARAMTEDQFGPSMTQWRSQQPSPVMPPPLPRLTSAMSAISTMSASSEQSFGSLPTRGIRQMNVSRLGRSEEVEEEDPPMEHQRFGPARGMSRVPSQGVTPSVPYPHAPPLRCRSASSPHVYQMPRISPAPNLPYMADQEAWPSNGEAETMATSSSTSLVRGTAYFTKRMSGDKRSSGESHSTETSETSSQQSPATPYGTNPGDSRGATPVSRQNSQDAVAQGSAMLIKVRCGEVSYELLHWL